MPRAEGGAASPIRFWHAVRLPGRKPVVAGCRPRAKIWCAIMLAWACATSAHAGQLDYFAGLSLSYESNITRVETNPQSDLTRALIGGLTYDQRTADLTAHVLGQVENRHYLKHTFPDETHFFFDGSGVWTLMPKRVMWSLQDKFSEVQEDLTKPLTPANLTKANALSTGPDVTIPMSSTNSVLMGGRYGRFDVQTKVNDSQRWTGYLRGLHAMSSQTDVSLNFEAGIVYFQPGTQLYDKVARDDLYGRFENRSPAATAVIDVGASWAFLYNGPILQPGRLVRLTISRSFSSQSRVRVSYADQISDTFSDQIAGLTGSTAPRDAGIVGLLGAVSGPALNTGDIYHSRRGDIGYANDNGRFGYTVLAYGRWVDFLNSNLNDYREEGGSFLLNWLYSGALRFRALASYVKRSFLSTGEIDADRTVGAGAIYRLNGNISITLEGGRAQRQSTVPGSSYVDDRITLVLGYGSRYADIGSRAF
jgi:hypothetical protein